MVNTTKSNNRKNRKDKGTLKTLAGFKKIDHVEDIRPGVYTGA